MVYKLVLSKQDLEENVCHALENACAYHAIGDYRLALTHLGEAYAYLDLLEEMDVWYEDVVIDEHCNSMIDILESSCFNIEYLGSKT